tara:strand:- start:1521 stop:1730 length:210 start_codon:yes stop_codon:yes gene_type:complete
MTKSVRTAMSWCFKNNIKVIIQPTQNKRDVTIEIHRDHKIQKGKEIYKQDKKLYKKIEELYLHLYKTLS